MNLGDVRARLYGGTVSGKTTLINRLIKCRNGEIIDFDRVVIETTGLADPAPVVQTLLTDSMLLDQYGLKRAYRRCRGRYGATRRVGQSTYGMRRERRLCLTVAL